MSLIERLERTVHPRNDVAARVIGDEAVVITPADSRVHELDPVATFIWSHCDGKRSGWALVDEVVQAFDVERDQAANDVDALLQIFSDRKLVELQPTL